MNNKTPIKKIVAIVLSFFPSINAFEFEHAKPKITYKAGDVIFVSSGKYKPETFFGENIHLLNNKNPEDAVYFSRHTVDATFHFHYGMHQYGHDALQFKSVFRNKGVWGDSGSVGTVNETTIKDADVVTGAHRHTFNRHLIWYRELWLKFCINDALDLSFDNDHYFMAGAFPFELGRGISLGSAFAVNPGVLGFYSDNSVDQYAFGFLFSGDVVKKLWSYDFYGAILENKAGSLKATTEKIYSQRIGSLFKQTRGFGSVDYVIAARSIFHLRRDKDRVAVLEPYFLFNDAPEQKVEFVGDAGSKLVTLGCAGEFVAGDFEFGFDTAGNFGRQTVCAWDRNRLRKECRDGFVVVVNSQVIDTNNNNRRALKTPENQAAINGSQNVCDNGQMIGDTGLQNTDNRFRCGYDNSYKGYMFVADGAYFWDHKNKSFAAMIGLATGDENPNQNLFDPADAEVDQNFNGFIPLQSIYSGSRVRSAFVLGGAGKLPRPLSVPAEGVKGDRFAVTEFGFTNLFFVGGALRWKPLEAMRRWDVHANFISYWQQHATNAFDKELGVTRDCSASKHFGIEMNLFFECELLHDFRFFAVGSVFIPGNHYDDIEGKPLNREQQAFIDRRDQRGIISDRVPTLGNDVAWTGNLGIDLKF